MSYTISHKKIRHTFAAFLLTLTLIPLSHLSGKAQQLTVNGSNWTITPATITEAGTNYSGTYESPPNQILITAAGPLLLGNMKLSAHYEPSPLWHNQLKLAIKRNGTGSSICLLCAIKGDENYIELATTDITLFTMTTPLLLTTYTDLNMQFRLSGVSVTLPATNYGSRVVFTLSDN